MPCFGGLDSVFWPKWPETDILIELPPVSYHYQRYRVNRKKELMIRNPREKQGFTFFLQ